MLVRLADAANAHFVACALGLGPDQMLARKRDAEGEHRFTGLTSRRDAIDKQPDLGAVGVDLDLGLRLTAVDITLSAQVDHRLCAVPGRLVEIERVLAQRAVKADQTLLVFAVLAALVATVGGKVEEIPNVGGPKPGPCLYHAQHMLMIQRLIFLGVVALFGAAAVEGGVGVRAVFAKANDPVGIFGVVFVKELVGLLQLA